jgi:CheY-like chemotaxis protein
MQVLILDADPSIDQSVLQYLLARSYEITITRTPDEALDLIHRTQFDCILLDVSTTAECLGLVEIRQLVRTSAVGFMAAVPVESLVAEAIAEGSIEFQSWPVLSENLERLPQPILVAGTNSPTTLFRAARDKELRISNARTLQFAMNLMVDGWCQVVWLHAEIPGRAQPDKAAILHNVGTKQLAILASGLSGSTPGITCSSKPEKATEFIALLRHIAGNQPAHCGVAEVRERRGNG